MKVILVEDRPGSCFLSFGADSAGSCEVELFKRKTTLILSNLMFLHACLESMCRWRHYLSPWELSMAMQALRAVSVKAERPPCCEVRMELDDECYILHSKLGPSVKIPLGTFAKKAILYFEEHTSLGLKGSDSVFFTGFEKKWKDGLSSLRKK